MRIRSPSGDEVTLHPILSKQETDYEHEHEHEQEGEEARQSLAPPACHSSQVTIFMRAIERQERRNEKLIRGGAFDRMRLDAASQKAQEEAIKLFFDYELKSSIWILVLTKLPRGSWARRVLTNMVTTHFLNKTAKKFASYLLMLEAEKRFSK